MDKQTQKALVQIMTYTKKLDIDDETLEKLYRVYNGDAVLVALALKQMDKMIQLIDDNNNGKEQEP